ncbi:MAG: ABC transporter permease subunit [Spirochaetales bacterium]|nr:ABC transporter permease subunit [Spirochaetales bacterium]
MQGKKELLSFGLGSISILGVFLIWYLVGELEVVSELFIPHPRSVWRAFLEVSTDGYRGGTLLVHLGSSLGRLIGGYFAAVFLGVPLGLLIGLYPKARILLNPLFEFYRPLPPLAYYSLLILWLGIGELSKITLLFLAALPPIIMNARAGVENIPLHRIDAARTLGSRPRGLFFQVIFPSCLPFIFTGLRVGIGFAYTTLISAEIVAAVNGIGWLVLDAGRFLRTDILFMAVIVMGVTGMVLDLLLRTLEQKLIPWKGYQ